MVEWSYFRIHHWTSGYISEGYIREGRYVSERRQDIPIHHWTFENIIGHLNTQMRDVLLNLCSQQLGKVMNTSSIFVSISSKICKSCPTTPIVVVFIVVIYCKLMKLSNNIHNQATVAEKAIIVIATSLLVAKIHNLFIQQVSLLRCCNKMIRNHLLSNVQCYKKKQQPNNETKIPGWQFLYILYKLPQIVASKIPRTTT